MNLENKTILIVGGAVGIGQATARLCAARGATVIVADFNTTDGTATAKEVNGTFIRTDVTDEASVQAMCAQIAQAHLRCSIRLARIHALGLDHGGSGGRPQKGDERLGGIRLFARLCDRGREQKLLLQLRRE